MARAGDAASAAPEPASAPRAGRRLLDPRTLQEIGDLRLVARAVVEGFLAGQHRDPRPSEGSEFTQYRGYEPGDDLRRLDWRVYARADRFVVRESQGERDVTVRFLLDATRSMAHEETERTAPGGREAPPLRKFDVARFLVASLAYLVDRQGDRVALAAARDGGVEALGTGRAGRELLDGLEALERLEPSGDWPPLEAALARLAPRRRGRELVVVVSDLHERGEEIRRALAALLAFRHEVLVFRVVARNEVEFAFQGDLVFEDLESGRRVAGNAERMRRPSLAAREADEEAWRRFVLERGAGWERVVCDEPLDMALRGFLLRRGRLPR